MDKLIAIVVVLILIWLWWKPTSTPKPVTPKPPVPVEKKYPPRIPGTTMGDDKLPDEFDDEPEPVTKLTKLIKETATYTRSDDCQDQFKDCKLWAANGECEINPDYMLLNCASSCKTCGLSLEQKSKLVIVDMHTPVKKCLYRGENYPPAPRLIV